MPDLYRICIPFWPPFNEPVPRSLETQHFVTNEIFHLKGPYGDVWGSIITVLIDGSFNYSIINGELYARQNLCQNSLHDNDSDIMLFPSDLPTFDESIDIYGLIGQSKLEFMSSYNYTDAAKDADVLDSVMSFKLSLWMFILFFIFLFAWLLKSKKSRTCSQYLRNFMDRLDQVFAHFIGQNSIDDDGIKVLAITLTFFSLMIIQYYNALIHTDLVVPVVPEVPYSYDDFASTVSVVYFINQTSSIRYFNESLEGYPERRLYNEVVRRNVTFSSRHPDTMPDWVTPLLENYYWILVLLDEGHVTWNTHLHMANINRVICTHKVYSEALELQELFPTLKTHFAPRFKNLYPWISSDPETRE